MELLTEMGEEQIIWWVSGGSQDFEMAFRYLNGQKVEAVQSQD